MKELFQELIRQLSLVPPGSWETVGKVMASISGALVLILTKRPETIAESARLFVIAFLTSTYASTFVLKFLLRIDSNELLTFGRFLSALGALPLHKRLEKIINGTQPPPDEPPATH